MDILKTRNMTLVSVDAHQRERIIRSLSLVDKYNNTIVKLYKECGDNIEIPISYIENCPVEDREWESIKMVFKGKLKPEQEAIRDSYLNCIQNNNGGILQAQTGFGKTVIAINIISKIALKTLIVVPTDYLMGQWRENLKMFSSITDEDIGICRADICDYKGKKVVIGMIHSLAKVGKYPKDFYNDFGFCVVDECHRLSAPVFSQSIPQFWNKYRLGLSATPRRKDGLEKVFLYHIGKVCSPLVKQKIKPVVVYAEFDHIGSHHAGCVWNGELSIGRYYNKLMNLKPRNDFIANIIAKLYSNGRDILVLSDRLKQLSNIKTALIDLNIPKDSIGIFTGQKKHGLDRKILLATYGSAGLGADIPRLSAVVLATPRVDVEQAVGRVLRKEMDKPQIIVDIIDKRSAIMVRWHYARDRFYRNIASKIIKI